MDTACMMGVDIGSGGCKVTIIDSTGNVKASGYREYPTYYPHPGWAEQAPEEWYQALRLTLEDIFSRGTVPRKSIASIAIGAATHTLVLLDGNNKVLRPAILWRDKRTIAQVEALRRDHGREIFDETLHAVNVNWTLPYLVWVRENEPRVWERAATILMPKDYIRHLLTGDIGTDYMDAHGTLLYNVREREWSEKVCRLADIPMRLLPSVSPPQRVVGGLTRSAARELGLVEGTPVVTGTTDQASEAFGAGAIELGQGILKLATAGNVAVITDEPHPSPPKVYAYFHVLPSKWYTLAGTISCAVCYRWLRDALCESEVNAAGRWDLNPYRLMDHLAAKAPVGCEGLIFHPNLQGAIWDPYLRGDFIGITSRHGKEHFIRAVLEGVAYSLYSCLREMDRLGVRVRDFRIIGGGAASPLWRQIVSDMVGTSLMRPAVDDSSFGTALVGGLGVGIFSSVEEAVRSCVQIVDEVHPNRENHEIYSRLFEVYERVSTDLTATSKLMHRILEDLDQRSLKRR
jgi:xylulokinase